MSTSQPDPAAPKSSQVEDKPSTTSRQSTSANAKPSDAEPSTHRPKTDTLQTSRTKEADEKYLQETDAAAKIVSNNIPKQPYIPLIESRYPFNPQHDQRYNWLKSTSFEAEEEHLQYQIFTYVNPDNPPNLWQLYNTAEGEARVAEIRHLEAMKAARKLDAPAAPSAEPAKLPAKRPAEAAAAESQPPRKKISLEAYKKNREAGASQTGTPLSHNNIRDDAKTSAPTKDTPAAGSKPAPDNANGAGTASAAAAAENPGEVKQAHEAGAKPKAADEPAEKAQAEMPSPHTGAGNGGAGPPATSTVAPPEQQPDKGSAKQENAETSLSHMRQLPPWAPNGTATPRPASFPASRRSQLPSWLPNGSARPNALLAPPSPPASRSHGAQPARPPSNKTGLKRPNDSAEPFLKGVKKRLVEPTPNSAFSQHLKAQAAPASSSNQQSKKQPPAAEETSMIVKLRIKKRSEFAQVLRKNPRDVHSPPSRASKLPQASPFRHRVDANSASAGPPDWKAEADRLHKLARELKEKANKHLQAAEGGADSTSATLAKVGAVEALEAILSFAQCFAVRRQFSGTARQCIDWIGLCDFAKIYQAEVKKFPHLNSLLHLVLSMAYGAVGSAHGQTKESDMNEAVQQSPNFKDQLEAFPQFIKSAQTKAMQYAASANRLLPRSVINNEYPELKQICEGSPIVLTANYSHLLKFGRTLLKEWGGKEQLKWTMQLHGGATMEALL